MSSLEPILDAALPPAVRERVRSLGSSRLGPRRGFVLYWMHSAVRATENPALDAALLLGEALRLPTFVYQGLSETHPHAADRHHRFILDGARDAHRDLARRGIASAFHLERSSDPGPHLLRLAQRAAMVVTEDVPVEPLRSWTRGLARRVETPVLAVDASCVLPLTLTRKAPQRAFEFRRETARHREERLEHAWQDVEPVVVGDLPDGLGFSPIDLDGSDLGGLIASCAIDHAIPPVPGTPGGSRAALERWAGFRDGGGLERYASLRDDPLASGTSRMSAYLHHGHVSALRLARDCIANGSAGARKHLEELLTWRELAWHFCHHSEVIDRVAALPGWAQRTLAAHRRDRRPRLLSRERLERAQSGDRLWDAAQRALLIHGELHGNLRMTWGKALLSLTPDADTALDLLIDFNQRYALDGRDPASDGGLLWCLGLFDRPFKPERRTWGALRPRETDVRATRLDVDRLARLASAPALARAPRVVVVGAGISGLACARVLSDQGLEPLLLDKGRGPGGRASTRRTQVDGTFATFDHGAQYFTARDPRLARHLESWMAEGVVAPWNGRFGTLENGELTLQADGPERSVGTPGMSAFLRHLGRGLDVRHGRRVRSLERHAGRWTVTTTDDESLSGFDEAVIALPAPQAVPLLAASPPLQARARGVEMQPCWAVMAAFDEEVPLELDGAFVNDSPLAWAARDSAKPGRPRGERWVLHADPTWSERHSETPAGEVAAKLLSAFEQAAGLSLPQLLRSDAHFWRFARPKGGLGTDCLYLPRQGIGCCGDWCAGGRIESAFLSGVALAGRILGAAHGAETERAIALSPLDVA